MKLNRRSQMGMSRPLLIMALTSLILIPLFAQAQEPAQSSPPAPPSQPVVIRLYVQDFDHLNAVAGVLDIWEQHPKDLYVVARVTPAQYEWLENLGYRLEIDIDKSAKLQSQAALDPRFHYFDDHYPNVNGRYVTHFLQDINADYPDLTELYDIGDAWMAGEPGEHDRDIWVLRVTNEDSAYGAIEDKPAFFLFANIHAREVATPELAIRYIKYLTEGYDGEGGYGVDADVTWLVNHNVTYILVMQNPDGHRKNEENINNYRRKNMDNDDGCSDPSSWGIDLNRNHTFLWGCCGGSSGSPCDETYRGPSPGSEPETQAFENYFAAVMQDQNGPNGDNQIPPAAPDDTSGIFISLHSYSDIVFWPWAFGGFGASPNFTQLRSIGRKFAYYNGYNPAGSLTYIMDGASDDWAYGKFGIASFTFEVGPSSGSCGGFFPSYGCLDGIDGMPRDFWAENRPAFLYAHKIARTPYMTVYGPDTENVVVLPDDASVPSEVSLTATIADRRYASDPLGRVGAAEYFIDAPGEDGNGNMMAPADGSWGGLVEGAIASVETAGLAIGRHYILIHGQNDDGDWGPFTAVFLDVSCSSYDLNCDGVLDLDDYALFAACLAGPGVTSPPGGCSESQFGRADLDDDLDVDVLDFASFQSAPGQ